MTSTTPRADGRLLQPVLDAARRLARWIAAATDALVGRRLGAPAVGLVPVRVDGQGRRGTLRGGASAGAGRHSEDAA